MKFHKQLFRHDPANGIIGDCQRTVFACLLDKDSPADVPHFGEKYIDDQEGWVESIQTYLRGEGYYHVEYAFNGTLDQIMAVHQNINPNLYYLLTGKSKNNTNHVVIARGNQIVWDPAIDDAGIVGPADDGFYWVGHLIQIRFCAPT